MGDRHSSVRLGIYLTANWGSDSTEWLNGNQAFLTTYVHRNLWPLSGLMETCCSWTLRHSIFFWWGSLITLVGIRSDWISRGLWFYQVIVLQQLRFSSWSKHVQVLTNVVSFLHCFPCAGFEGYVDKYEWGGKMRKFSDPKIVSKCPYVFPAPTDV